MHEFSQQAHAPVMCSVALLRIATGVAETSQTQNDDPGSHISLQWVKQTQ